MDRKDFFKKACLYGLCGCAGMSMISATNGFANPNSNLNKTDDEPDWRIEFMQARFAKLIDILDGNVDKKVKDKILEEMGRECGRLGMDKLKKYVGDVEGFLKSLEESWAQKATFDKDKNQIGVIGKKSEKCFCPFVDNAKMSKDFCACSLGWQKEVFGTILGKDVDAKVAGSKLRGGESCDFTITVK